MENFPIIVLVFLMDRRYLHWNFVSMLLSDLFGIQTRSGCMCAGPYSMKYGYIDGRMTD